MVRLQVRRLLPVGKRAGWRARHHTYSKSLIADRPAEVYASEALARDTFHASIGLLMAFWDDGIPGSRPYWSKMTV
jgi:hypothetical protein